jgi:hypothetical protein
MSESKDNSLNVDDKGLESLLASALEDVRADIEEADKHVKAIATKIENPDKKSALEQYSIMYQEALKVKGVVRDRHIKVIKMIQDRIRVKEVMNQTKGSVPWMLTPDAIQELMENSKEEKSENE